MDSPLVARSSIRDDIRARHVGRRVASRFVRGICARLGERIRSAAKAEASVEVKFVRAAPPPPPPPPPAPKKKSEPKPKTDAPKKVVPPTAMIQPKEIAEEMKAPNPNEPPEPEPETDDTGSGAGVVGGVAGAGGFEEAPRYVTAGFRPPREKERGCVASSMRVPPALAGFVSGPITVKFAVRRDGSVSQIQIMTQVPDPRIADIVRQALMRCEFVPGADAQGNPTTLWAIMPVRFTSG